MPLPPSPRQRQPGLDLLKWLALASMLIDHLRFLLPADPVLQASFIPGRLAFPWFCLALAANIARQPPGRFAASQIQYLGTLLLFALLSEPAHDLMLGNTLRFNIFFTLALGWLLAWAVHSRQLTALLLAVLLALGSQRQAAQITYGLEGVLLPALCLLALQHRLGWLAASAGALLANLNPRLLAHLLDGQIRALLITGVCLLAVPLGLWLLNSRTIARWRIAPVGRWAYAFYPVHMLAIATLASVLARP
ncbi:TraX family protein [Pseudomonas sp. NW5]|uniref:TraX family protein n=1 Tax=Pseudomonas sp. NW5 TaxID=2934934 RepID=UPI002022930A|nr:TraX family protein [Pseudomonas sp. NW5]MCL7462647.1 conjugal transfer protein TraX [Pseudomonas sp. NW5]